MHLARLHSAANGVHLSELSHGVEDDEPDFKLGHGTDAEDSEVEDPWRGESSPEPTDDADDFDVFADESAEGDSADDEERDAADIACL